MKLIVRVILGCLVLYTNIHVALPHINLGSSNILDGGPTRPHPGWYWSQVSRYYTANNLFDHCRQELSTCPLPLNTVSTTTQFFYQTKKKLRNHITWGFDFTLPFLLYSQIDTNKLGIVSSGAGVGDLALGTYFQWDPIMYHDRPLFVHRLELAVSFPTGKFIKPSITLPVRLNPGNNIFFINPYWAATLYFTTTWAISWRLFYLWCSENRTTQVQFGQALHFNYSLEHQIKKHFWGAIVGYYLRQLTDNKLCNVAVPTSREQIFAVGPGALYAFPHDWLLFGYIYFEALARNRTQGTSFVLRLLKHF